METSTRPHHGREKDSASGTAVLMNIKGELFHTNYVKGLVKKYKGGGGGWAGAFRNVVVRKHMTHPFQLEQNGVTHP